MSGLGRSLERVCTAKVKIMKYGIWSPRNILNWCVCFRTFEYCNPAVILSNLIVASVNQEIHACCIACPIRYSLLNGCDVGLGTVEFIP